MDDLEVRVSSSSSDQSRIHYFQGCCKTVKYCVFVCLFVLNGEKLTASLHEQKGNHSGLDTILRKNLQAKQVVLLLTSQRNWSIFCKAYTLFKPYLVMEII